MTVVGMRQGRKGHIEIDTWEGEVREGNLETTGMTFGRRKGGETGRGKWGMTAEAGQWWVVCVCRQCHFGGGINKVRVTEKALIGGKVHV